MAVGMQLHHKNSAEIETTFQALVHTDGEKVQPGCSSLFAHHFAIENHCSKNKKKNEKKRNGKRKTFCKTPYGRTAGYGPTAGKDTDRVEFR